MLNPHWCNLALLEVSHSLSFVYPLSSRQKHMNDSDTQVKPRPIEIDVPKVDRYQLALDAFEPVVHSTLVHQVRHKHVSCAFANKGIIVRSQSNLEERASWALCFEVLRKPITWFFPLKRLTPFFCSFPWVSNRQCVLLRSGSQRHLRAVIAVPRYRLYQYSFTVNRRSLAHGDERQLKALLMWGWRGEVGWGWVKPVIRTQVSTVSLMVLKICRYSVFSSDWWQLIIFSK